MLADETAGIPGDCPTGRAGARRRIAARSLSWAILESTGVTALSLLTLLIFTRVLSPSELGSAAVGLSIMQILALPVVVLFQDALVQGREVGPLHFDTALSVSLVLGAVLCALCWWDADVVGRAVGNPQAAFVLRWSSLSLPACGIESVLTARQRREFGFRALALRSLLGRAMGSAVAIALAWLGAGLWAPIAQQLLSISLATTMLWLTTPHRPQLDFGWAELRHLFGFGIRNLGANAFFSAIPRVFLLQVGVLLGTEAVGYLSLAFRTVDMLRDVIAGAIARLALPMLSRLGSGTRLLRRGYASLTENTCAIVFPVFAGLAAVAPEVVAVVFGSRWLPAEQYVVVLCAVALLYFVRLNAWTALAALGHPLHQVASLLVESAVLIAWPLLASPSPNSAVVAWVLRALLAAPVDAWMLRRVSCIPIGVQLRGVPSLLLLSAALAAAVVGLGTTLPAGLPNPLRLGVLVAFGIATYPVLLLLVRRDLARRLIFLAATALSPAP